MTGGTSVSSYAFCDCFNITSITLPNSLTTIESEAFYKCNAITSITIPVGVTSIGYNAFYGCSRLLDVYYEKGEAEWSNIDINSGNSNLISANVHYNYSGKDNLY